MATKPTPGGSDGTYGTELNAFLDVGHDADGTHMKSQMLTDMEWTPTSYAGEQSITFPNGLIFKHGIVSSLNAGDPKTVNFAAAFPTAVVSASTSWKGATTSRNDPITITTFSVSQIILDTLDATPSDAYWQAWGY